MSPSARGRGALLVALLAMAWGCRAVYVAPAASMPKDSTIETPRAEADPGDLDGVAEAETSCRRSLHTNTVAASLRAIDTATERIGRFCSIEPVRDDPLLWRVWCRADALFKSGHYLRSNSEPFDCGDVQAGSAFECAGSILAELLLAPGHAQRVEVVSVGHVDQQNLSSEGDFIREPCVELQGELAQRGVEAWAPAQGDPGPIEVWNTRLSWCRAAWGASEALKGLRSGSGRSTEVDVAVVGAGSQWQAARGRCPVRPQGQDRGQCAPARRVDVLLRFVPAEHSVQSECRPPANLKGGAAARALYCYEDCSAMREVGKVRQQYTPASSAAFSLFEAGSAQPEGWIVRQPRGEQPVNAAAVETILGMRVP